MVVELVVRMNVIVWCAYQKAKIYWNKIKMMMFVERHKALYTIGFMCFQLSHVYHSIAHHWFDRRPLSANSQNAGEISFGRKMIKCFNDTNRLFGKFINFGRTFTVEIRFVSTENQCKIKTVDSKIDTQVIDNKYTFNRQLFKCVAFSFHSVNNFVSSWNARIRWMVFNLNKRMHSFATKSACRAFFVILYAITKAKFINRLFYFNSFTLYVIHSNCK